MLLQTLADVIEHNTSPLAALISLPNAATTLCTKRRRLFSAIVPEKSKNMIEF